jgi:hypothetical protein
MATILVQRIIAVTELGKAVGVLPLIEVVGVSRTYIQQIQVDVPVIMKQDVLL